MLWGILIVGIVGIIAYYIIRKQKEEAENAAAYARAQKNTGNSSTVSSLSATTVSLKEAIEDQNLRQCLARFCGAIDAVRKKNSWRSERQQGAYTISRLEDGKYRVHGFYDHDADNYVEDALRSGGYLNYLGMSYYTDTVSYNVNGIRDENTSVEPYFSQALTSEYFRRYFGSEIVITHVTTESNQVSISFRFVA